MVKQCIALTAATDVFIKGAHQTRFRATKSGTYHAVLFDNFGCSVVTEKQNVVIDSPKPGVTYPVEYAVIDIPVFLEARQIGSTALWSPATFLDNPASFTPSFKSSSDQLYTVEIRTISGCVTVDTQLVKIVSHVDIFVPTAFTPNGDGLNEVLRPTLMGIKELKYFRVYNRWGQVLFETKTERAGWDGTQNGTRMPTQVVVWITEGIGVDGRTYVKKGTSTLVR
ncbi:MAG: gliding motility-associated C-terminal domain-containing protein [Bacteroidetes bacterium]|nr:MAG: gliding motility-associated C-terminal domain-containing protein [Bacteroidota bacterium]